MEQVIKIACQGYTTLGLDELVDLQGILKDLSEENYVKLRNSMVEYGFSFPVFYWEDTDGKKYILDSHQRTRTLKKMRDEGWSIPPLPADKIEATDKVEAKKKLLLLNSRYGTMTREGFDAFIDEPGFEIGNDIEDLLVLPEIEYWDEKSEEEEKEQQEPKGVICPGCGKHFLVSESGKQE